MIPARYIFPSRWCPRAALCLTVAATLLAGPARGEDGARLGAAGTESHLPRVSTAQISTGQVSAGHVSGIVRGEGLGPVPSAHIYAYGLADLRIRKVLTDLAGHFRFESLPVGVYNIVAFKSGFVPAVIKLSRPDLDRDQAVDLHLVPEEPEDARAQEDYWQVRNRIPADVLREIESLRDFEGGIEPGTSMGRVLDESLSHFTGGVEASAGVDDMAGLGDGQMAGGRLDFRGELAGLDIGVVGDFWRLQPASSDDSAGTRGSSNQLSLSFDLKSESDSRFNLTTSSSRLVTRQDGVDVPVDFAQMRLSYSGRVGERGESAIAAQVVEESGFYRRGLIELGDLPEASRTLQLDGSYSQEIGDRSRIETGLRYRERQAELVPLHGDVGSLYDQGLERVDLFGVGGYRVRPAMLIEYGIYSVLQGGDLSLAPQGGVVVQLNPHWQSAFRMSGRVSSEERNFPSRPRDFLPVLFQPDERACSEGEQRCYQLQFSRQEGDDEVLSLGAVHREFGETLRLYFSEDFFDHQESLYLVPGDQLPELQVAVTRRLSPNVLTRLTSSFASGGGGVFYATSDEAYENEIRYFITSIDTRFRSTSTGVFIALHQLEQHLNPRQEGESPMVPVTSQRLELRLSQDLNVLFDLAAEWALHLNMELARGNFTQNEEETRRRVLGGIAVKF